MFALSITSTRIVKYFKQNNTESAIYIYASCVESIKVDITISSILCLSTVCVCASYILEIIRIPSHVYGNSTSINYIKRYSYIASCFYLITVQGH